MERPELTMEDVVTIVNSIENDFVIHIEFSEEGSVNGKTEESV